MALYSRKDLTREKYAVSLSFSGQPFRLRLRKDNLEFALDVMTSMCFVHSKSSLTVTPRYLASFTSSSTCPDNSYWYVLYIVKLSSYIKEQLKFALFLGVKGGGGAKQPSEVSNIDL